MDSHQPGNKRGIEVSLQNQDDGMPSTNEEREEGAEVKRFKQELHPLQTGAVLEKIFSNLDVESIKAARQVNPLWGIEGAKMLITKCYIKIPSVVHVGDGASKFKAMDEFKAFLSHKPKEFSAIPNIIVDAVADVDLWKYLGVLGQQVKSLKICDVGDDAEFLKNLLDLMPNPKYLRFKKVDYEPALIKMLTSVMQTLENARNSLTISFLNLYPDNEDELGDIEKFASCKNIIIEELKFKFSKRLSGAPNFNVRISSMLGKLLSTSQNILNNLTLENCHLILPILEFPCMTALTIMNLIFSFKTASQFSNCKFSASFQFSEKVPELKEFQIFVKKNPHTAQCCVSKMFESAGRAPSVKSVSCWGNVSDFDIYHIFKAFPNMENFGARVHPSEAMLRSLWKHGANLKILRLVVRFNSPFAKFDDLDASFTGLPIWTVDEIKKAPNLDPFTLAELEELRVDSILNLKELKHFSIYFAEDCPLPERTLAVASKYAFKLMPNDSNVVVTVKGSSGFKKCFDELSKLSKFSNVIMVYKE